MSSTANQPATTTDVIFQGILTFLLPFFLRPACGDARNAAMTILQLIEAFDAATARELDLAGQILILSTAAMDSLRRSAAPDLPDTKVLRYRASAASLTRAAARLQKTLDTLQKAHEPDRKPIRDVERKAAPADRAAPRPVAPSSQSAPRQPAPSPQTVPQQAAQPTRTAPTPPKPDSMRREHPPLPDPAIEAMQIEAHAAITPLKARTASLTSVAFPVIPDPAMAATAAAQAAMAQAGFKTAAFDIRTNQR